ncbi:unnamed protein product [Diatraea saccharalis]|uniref:Uncharacterized protein n=1 Tax=Diatraea saccharalis TaxID=40085 RepID=A0A9N9W801_9NEOP|nr:unnamed protein product [Diatraea saccharalis]
MLPVTHVAISPTLSDVATVHRTAPARAPRAPRRPRDSLDTEPDERGDASSEEDFTASYERDEPDKYQSIIRVHTVNARFVGSVRVPEVVECACYSGAPEGVSVNVIAAGTRAGALRLYSSWDLRPLPPRAASAAPAAPATAPPRAPAPPLLGLSYSSDSQVLFGWYGDGSAVAWESDPSKPAPRIVPAHALL